MSEIANEAVAWMDVIKKQRDELRERVKLLDAENRNLVRLIRRARFDVSSELDWLERHYGEDDITTRNQRELLSSIDSVIAARAE